MKRILFISLFALTSFVFCEEYEDVVYLKDGSIIKGTIIEQIPNESLKIKTTGGSIFVYRMDEISKISKELIKSLYSYNNLIGGIYVNISGDGIYAVNSQRRINKNLNAGFMWTTRYAGGGSLPGQSTQYIPYIGIGFIESKYITPLILFGGSFTSRDWNSSSYNTSGTINHFGLFFGLNINIKLFNHFGFGFIAAMGENFYFRAYSDGTAGITDTDWDFYPALTINIYDIFSSKKN